MPTATDLRTAIDDLSTLAAADLRELWREVSTASEVRDALLEVLPALTETYALASASIAADWYDELREQAEVRGRFSAITADLGDLGTDELARWGVAPLFTDSPDRRRAQTLIDGGLQLRIANASRDTITESTYADPQARGWQRTGSGACAFCRMLIDRGAVYSRGTSRFASHDHCNCQAIPVFGGQPLPVDPYTKSRRRISDADRARVRQYLADNPGV